MWRVAISALRRQQALEEQRNDGEETLEGQHAELMLDVMASSLGSPKNTPTDAHHNLPILSTLPLSPLHQAITENNDDQESDKELHLHLDGRYGFADMQGRSHMAGGSEGEDVEESAGFKGSDVEDGDESVASIWTSRLHRVSDVGEELKQEFPHLLPPDNPPPDLPTFPPSVPPDNEELLPSLWHWSYLTFVSELNMKVKTLLRYILNERSRTKCVLQMDSLENESRQCNAIRRARHFVYEYGGKEGYAEAIIYIRLPTNLAVSSVTHIVVSHCISVAQTLPGETVSGRWDEALTVLPCRAVKDLIGIFQPATSPSKVYVLKKNPWTDIVDSHLEEDTE
ncbi:hypothetical protein BT69DRAFT_1375814 [Atractiella rhizophila]|nr:hypothetical protein BT69DRAFT_1375814 [Atractiella rhizophila]